jgi:magnesium-protoporphyrin IX monomethyl ester (oxidative) cyclase
MAANNDSVPFAGPLISLEKLVDCACTVSMDKLMSVLYRNEWIRNNPGRLTGLVFSLLADREVLGFSAKIASLYLGTWRNG